MHCRQVFTLDPDLAGPPEVIEKAGVTNSKFQGPQALNLQIKEVSNNADIVRRLDECEIKAC